MIGFGIAVSYPERTTRLIFAARDRIVALSQDCSVSAATPLMNLDCKMAVHSVLSNAPALQ